MLRLEGLHAAYGKVEALKGISLDVRAGELVTLIGANGAGKTSTLKTISGLLRPTIGRILFEGDDIHHLTPREILTRGIAHCPEGRRVFPYMSVRENLEMGAYARRDLRAIREDLERVFTYFPVLGERLHQTAGTLSGGEQQMLAIGRALMARPRLLLLDEPALGLAPAIIETTFSIIREIRQRGVTVLMVEQNAYHALRMADRGYVMETGQIALEGRATDLIENEHVKRAYLGG
ncbi:MAG: ABC transporter ATP-binding protein [Candidatus Rokubacteria bacterium]|nr:ABC transporter ATP-binding protein [Candidatus Rokubacteria bacterium]